MIINSSLYKIDTQSSQTAFNKTYENYALRVGIITKSIPPTSERSISKLYQEYDVLVYEQNGNTGGAPSVYRNCTGAQSFGSIADYLEYTYRPQTKAFDGGNKIDALNQDGALVLMLCVNGQGDRGIIIAALNHPNRDPKVTDEIGLAFEYNGLAAAIDAAGAFKITFKGATDSMGLTIDKELGETTLSVEKDGSVQFQHKGITFRLDKTGKVVLAAEGQVEITGSKGATINFKESVSLKTEGNLSLDIKDLLAKASGSATLEFQSLSMKGQQVELKANTIDVRGQLVNIKGSQITTDGLNFLGGVGGFPVLVATTVMIGTCAVGPVVSFAVGPYATKVFAR